MQLFERKLESEFRKALITWYLEEKGICRGEGRQIPIIYGYRK